MDYKLQSPADHSNGGSRTFLWCYPRTVSTAFTKCISFIENTEVWFEHYCWSNLARSRYRSHTNTDLPMEFEGNESAYNTAKGLVEEYTQSPLEPDRLSYESVKRRLENATGHHVFVKDMAYAITKDTLQYLPNGFRHTFIIRNPFRFLYSYRKAIISQWQVGDGDDPWCKVTDEQSFDIEKDDPWLLPGCFLVEQHDLWMLVKEHLDTNPVVIDSDDLLTNPKETLSAYCAAVGLPYSDSLLRWDDSADAILKMKAPGDRMLVDMMHVYGHAAKSSQFTPPSKMPSHDQMTPDVII